MVSVTFHLKDLDFQTDFWQQLSNTTHVGSLDRQGAQRCVLKKPFFVRIDCVICVHIYNCSGYFP